MATGMVNISRINHELMKDKFNCTYRKKIEAKNKGKIDICIVDRSPAEIEVIDRFSVQLPKSINLAIAKVQLIQNRFIPIFSNKSVMKYKNGSLFLSLTTLLLYLSCGSVFGQNRTIDSLKTILKEYDVQRGNKPPEIFDSVKVRLLDELCRAFVGSGNYAKAKQYAEDELSLAEKIKFKKGIANSYDHLGYFSIKEADFETALKYYKAAYKLQVEIGEIKLAARCLLKIGDIYQLQNNYPEALTVLLNLIKINKKIGDEKAVGSTYQLIGNVYYSQGNFPQALENYIAALKIAEKVGDKHGILLSYLNIGNIYASQEEFTEALKNYRAALRMDKEPGEEDNICTLYNNIANIYSALHDFPKALENYLSSLEIAKKIGDRQLIARTTTNIGVAFARQANYPKALEYLQAALKIQEGMGDREAIASTANNIGSVYNKQRKFNEATLYFSRSLEIAKMLGIKDEIKYNYMSISTADSATGNWKNAYNNYKMYILYRDSMFNEENTKKLVQAQMTFDFEKKEQSVKLEQEKKDALTQAELKKQRIIRNSIGGGLLVVLLFSIVVFRQRNKIAKGKKRSDELLLNILPAETAEELKATGFAKAKDFDQVTVLFTDFKNFTAMSEKLNAQELVGEINYCYSAFDEIITKYGIEKIKTIGDSYMCAGGLPVTSKTNGEDTVNAALAIRDFMSEEKAKREAEGKYFFEIRIGLHTGPVVAGIVGIKKFAYDIWGDTVNIASRMESSGEPGMVNISGSTYELVKDKFNCTYRGKIEAKNKGKIDMYFVDQSLAKA